MASMCWSAGRSGSDIARELNSEQLSLVLDGLGGDTATALVGALRFGGAIVTYGSLGGWPVAGAECRPAGARAAAHGFLSLTWLSHAPRSEIVDTYRYLGSLVADGSLSVPVEATYRLDDHRRALSSRRGQAGRQGAVRLRSTAVGRD